MICLCFLELIIPFSMRIDLGTIVGYGLAILGILFSFYFYFRSKRIKSPVFRTRTTRLIQREISQIDSLEVYYDGIKQPALTITKIAFWNKGRETISASDISTKDQLRIEINKKYDFLSCDILNQTKIANNFSTQISEDKKSILLQFDYIDYDEGVVLKIRHTGSSDNNLVICGSIKAVKEIVRINEDYEVLSRPKDIRIMAFFYLILGMIGCLSLVLWNETLSVFFTIMCYMSIVICLLYPIWSLRLNSRLIPKSLMEDYKSEDF